MATQQRVAIVDDSTMMRHLLRTLFETDERFEVIGEAADGGELLDHLEEWSPDVVILDLEMPGVGGLEALPQIVSRRPQTRVVVFSSHADAREDALAAGAATYLEKGTSIDDLLAAAAPRTGRFAQDRAVDLQP